MIGVILQRILVALAGLVITTRVVLVALPEEVADTPVTPPVASASEPGTPLPSPMPLPTLTSSPTASATASLSPTASPTPLPPDTATPQSPIFFTLIPVPSPVPTGSVIPPPPTETPTPQPTVAPLPAPTCPPGFVEVEGETPLITFCIYLPPLLAVCCRAD